jgi:hypothetical protein
VSCLLPEDHASILVFKTIMTHPKTFEQFLLDGKRPPAFSTFSQRRARLRVDSRCALVSIPRSQGDPADVSLSVLENRPDLGRTVRLGRTIQCSRRASVPRAALRSALGYLLLPLWGGRIGSRPEARGGRRERTAKQPENFGAILRRYPRITHSNEALRPRQRVWWPSRPENHFMKGISLAVPSPKGWQTLCRWCEPPVPSVPKAALRSALGYLLLPLWGGRIDPSPPDLPWTSPGSLRGISHPLVSFDALHSHFGSSTIFGQPDIQDSTSNDFPTT